MKFVIAGLVVSLSLACRSTDAMGATSIIPEKGKPPTNLEQIVHEYQRQAGVTLTYDETTATRLQAISVTPVGPGGDVLLIDAGTDATGQFEVIPLRFAEAGHLVAPLIRLVQSAGAGGEAPDIRVAADARTNSILLRADAEHMDHLKALIALLDKEQTAGE